MQQPKQELPRAHLLRHLGLNLDLRLALRLALIVLAPAPAAFLFYQHIGAASHPVYAALTGALLLVVVAACIGVLWSYSRLRVSESRQRAIAESIPHGGIFLFDQYLRFKVAQGGGLLRLGLDANDFLGRTPAEVLPAGVAENLLPGMLKALEGESSQTEVSYWGRLMRLDTMPLKNDARIKGGLVVAQDVTSERMYQNALAENERRMSTLIGNMPGMVYRCVFDEKRSMEFVSDGCVELVGYAPEDMVLNRRVSWPDLIHPDDREDVRREVEAAASEDRAYVLFYRISTRTEERKWVWERGVVLTHEESGVVFLEGIVIDNTARRQAEDEARLREEQLVQADRLTSLGTLVAGVAHEINNPNTVISLNMPMVETIWKDAALVLEQRHAAGEHIELAGAAWPDIRDEVTPLLTKVMDSSRRIRNIVADLKGFARQENTGDQAVDMVEVIRAAISLVENKIVSSTEYFSVDLPGSPVVVRGDFQRLEQVVVNALINACEALTSSDQGVAVSVESAQNQVRVIVRDEGSGMDRDALKHALEPFFTTKQSTGGTGLGLSISHGIILKHGGTINLKSEPGKGTRCIIVLPQERGREADDEAAHAPSEKDALEGRR